MTTVNPSGDTSSPATEDGFTGQQEEQEGEEPSQPEPVAVATASSTAADSAVSKASSAATATSSSGTSVTSLLAASATAASALGSPLQHHRVNVSSSCSTSADNDKDDDSAVPNANNATAAATIDDSSSSGPHHHHDTFVASGTGSSGGSGGVAEASTSTSPGRGGAVSGDGVVGGGSRGGGDEGKDHHRRRRGGSGGGVPQVEDDDDDDSNDAILSLSFNQDGGCLAVGTRRGFRICNVHPYAETFRRTFCGTDSSSLNGGGGGGVGIVEMLFRCNLLALVGGGPSPRYPPNKVLIWDDHRSKPIGELSFRNRVLSVRLRRDRIAVALAAKVYVYNFADLKLIDQIPTVDNPRGLLCLSPDPGSRVGTVLACPGITRGGVRVELYDARKTTLIEAHEGGLSAMALSVDGSLLCTASERGTIVRVFDSRRGGSPLRELRRGVERARVSCVCFDVGKRWVACASDRGTVHVFSIARDGGAGQGDSELGQVGGGSMDNDRGDSFYVGSARSKASDHRHGKAKKHESYHHGGGGSGSFVSSLVPKFARPFTIGEGEASFAQIRGVEDPAVCAFVPDAHHIIAVVGRDGSLLLSNFESGGEGERVAYHRFFRRRQGHGHGHGAVASKHTKEDGGGRTSGGTACSHGQRKQNGISEKNGKNDRVQREMDGVIFGDEEQEDGFIAVDNNRHQKS